MIPSSIQVGRCMLRSFNATPRSVSSYRIFRNALWSKSIVECFTRPPKTTWSMPNNCVGSFSTLRRNSFNLRPLFSIIACSILAGTVSVAYLVHSDVILANHPTNVQLETSISKSNNFENGVDSSIDSAAAPFSHSRRAGLAQYMFSPFSYLSEYVQWSCVFVKETTLILFRFTQLSCYFVPLLVVFPFYYFNTNFLFLSFNWWPRWLVWTFEYAGPTFTKLGQWASTRPDLFNLEICQQLSKLHSHVHPHPFHITEERILHDFNLTRLDEVFSQVDEIPTGSGCIAQVHRAILRPEWREKIIQDMAFTVHSTQHEQYPQQYHQNLLADCSDAWFMHLISQEEPTSSFVRRQSSLHSPDSSTHSFSSTFHPHLLGFLETGEVALKVRHPRVRRLIERDLYILSSLAMLADRLIPGAKYFGLPNVASSFSKIMRMQLDLTMEGRNLCEFNRRFAHHPYHVFFPMAVPPFISEHVLMETYEPGDDILSAIRELDITNTVPQNSDHRKEDDNRLSRGTSEDVPRQNAKDTLKQMSLGERREIAKRIAKSGLRALFKMMTYDNLVHGDLHPGNLLIRWTLHEFPQRDDPILFHHEREHHRERRMSNRFYQILDMIEKQIKTSFRFLKYGSSMESLEALGYELVMLDVGIVTQMNEKDRRNFLELFAAVVDGRGEEAGRLLLERAPVQHCQDPVAFQRAIAAVVERVTRQSFQLETFLLGDILKEVLELVRHHRVQLETNFTNLLIGVTVLEGLGRQLDPQLDVLHEATPFLSHLRREMAFSKRTSFLLALREFMMDRQSLDISNIFIDG